MGKKNRRRASLLKQTLCIINQRPVKHISRVFDIHALFLSTRRKEPKAARGGIGKGDSPRTPIGTRGYGVRLHN